MHSHMKERQLNFKSGASMVLQFIPIHLSWRIICWLEAAQQCEHNSAELWAPSPRDLLSWFRGGTCVQQPKGDARSNYDETHYFNSVSVLEHIPNPDLSKSHQLIQHWSPRLCHIGVTSRFACTNPTRSLCARGPAIHPCPLPHSGSVVTLVRGCMYTSEHVILQNEQLENLGNLYSINCSLDGIETTYLKWCVDLS